MMSEEMFNSVVGRTCTRRFGEGIEVGAMCAFLASAEAAHIDGSILAVDGGILVKG
jgi:NAD(P)-dependent dehydrogenase (short-subunit alcohol dehydrogenase family)